MMYIQQALLLDDIVRLIFTHIEYELSSLASAARVCQVFKEPALDLLWKNLNGFGFWPFTYVLPTRREEYLIHLEENISEHSWARFRSYALRVREFGLRCVFTRLHQSAYDTIIQALATNGPIFPRLQTFHLNAPRRGEPLSQILPVPVEYLLTDSINTIMFHYQGNYTVPRIDFKAVLSTLIPQYSSNIRQITILSDLLTDHTPQILSLRYLRRIIVDRIDHTESKVFDHFQKLSTLPYLEHLTLCTKRRASPSNYIFHEPVATGGYISLRTLKVSSDPKTLTYLLGTLLPRLTSLTASDSRPSNMSKEMILTSLEHWRTCFRAIAQQPAIRNICLSIHCDWSILVTDSKEMTLLHFIEPLLSLSDLQEFYLKDAINFRLSDRDIAKIASAWPNANSLVFPPSPQNSNELTIKSVEDMVENFPNLKYLQLTINEYVHMAYMMPSLSRTSDFLFWSTFDLIPLRSHRRVLSELLFILGDAYWPAGFKNL